MYKCTNKNQKLLQDSLGKKFGRLTVIEDAGVTAKNNKRLVKCLCDCGIEKIIKLSLLRNGNTKSCGCFRKEIAIPKTKIIQNIMIERGLWESDDLVATAKKIWNQRYNDGDISFNEFLSLSKQDCFYCGKSPSNNALTRKENYFTYNGLDRVDNKQGHNKNNVVPCCYYCNISKSDRTSEDFLIWIKTLYKRNCQNESI